MTREQLEKLRIPIPFKLSEWEEKDKYGYYRTGAYRYKGKVVIVDRPESLWHLSVSSGHTLGYYELKDIRYTFLPDAIHVWQGFPPRAEFVNLHENCFHLWQIEGEI